MVVTVSSHPHHVDYPDSYPTKNLYCLVLPFSRTRKALYFLFVFLGNAYFIHQITVTSSANNFMIKFGGVSSQTKGLFARPHLANS